MNVKKKKKNEDSIIYQGTKHIENNRRELEKKNPSLRKVISIDRIDREAKLSFFLSRRSCAISRRVVSLSVHACARDIKRNNRENYEGLDRGTVIASLVGKSFPWRR